MRATDILEEEHQVILSVVDSMERILDKPSTAENTAGFFLDASDFIKNFADGCHHAKEERVLFKHMEKLGVTVEGGPIGVMLAEHEQGRQINRAMKAAAEKWQAGDAGAFEAIKTNALAYVNLMRNHITKENNMLFPLANRVIPPDVETEIMEKFELIELEETSDGAHEKYHALAEKLERDSFE